MSNTSVLRALSAVTGAPLKFSSLVRSSLQGDLDELYYLCFGKHCLFIVDREMDGLARDGIMYTCPYTCLERCEADLTNPEIFAIYIIDNVPLIPAYRTEADENGIIPKRLCFKSKVVFHSSDREKVLTEFETFFRTDYMFQHWQLPSSPFVVDVNENLDPGFDQSNVAKRPSPPTPDLGLEKFGNYYFFKPKSFERQSYGGRTSMIVKYVDTMEDYTVSGTQSETVFPDTIEIFLHEMHPINTSRFSLTVGGQKDITEVAEHYMKEITDNVVDYRIIGVPQRHQKKFNHSQDISQFDCWKVHIRTAGRRHNTAAAQAAANRDVCIIVVQRKFIPPMMDKFQNIVVICTSRYAPIQLSQKNVLRCETIVDSLSFDSKSFTWDSLVVQTKANALMLDEDSYAWYASNLEIYPEAVKLARTFCASILRLLSRAGLPYKTDGVFNEAALKDLSDDPFEYSLRLENQIPGLKDNNQNEVLVREWKARVWRYLAFCVDGGLLPGILDITKMSLHVQQHPRRLQRLSQVLQMLLYFRAVDENYRQVALPLKIADERLMQNFTFNEHVMESLLNSGFIKKILDDTADPLEYPRFIVRLLQRGKDRTKWGYSLQYTVCKQIARSSAAFGASINTNRAGETESKDMDQSMLGAKTVALSDLALRTIVPALIDLLIDESSNEKIQVIVVSTLVNFTKNNTVIKNKVMAGGAIRRICEFLHSKHDDLVRHSCSLLNNCTKSEQYRTQVAKFKAVEALMRLLQRNTFPPYYRSTRILIQASAVIGNLASDTRLRQRITNSLGYEVESDRNFKGTRFEQSRAIRVLVDLLMDKYGELTAQRDNLRVTVIFALKNLAIRHEENKRTIGRLAIGLLLSIVDQIPNGDKNRVLIDVALRCIFVLSFERSNCKILQKCNIEKILQAQQATFPDLVRQIQNKLNTTQ